MTRDWQCCKAAPPLSQGVRPLGSQDCFPSLILPRSLDCCPTEVPIGCEVSGESTELRAKDKPGGALAGQAENLGGGEKPQAERPGKRQSPWSLWDVRPGLPSALLQEPLPHGHAVTRSVWTCSALCLAGSPGLQPHGGERMLRGGHIKGPLRSFRPQFTFWPQRFTSLSHAECIHFFPRPPKPPPTMAFTLSPSEVRCG